MKAGWRTSTLGEVSSFLNRGISPKYLETGGVCVLNQKCIRDHRINFESSRRHDEQAKKVGGDRFIQAGDVLVNSTGTGTLGRVAQLREAPPEPTTVDSHVTIVRPIPSKFYPEFFGYMMVVIEDAIKEAGEGCGGQTELARSVLAEKFSVHYPDSISEQQRIVTILDEAFEGIATAKANAEKNLQNARALFESHLQAVFSQRGEGWVEKRLDEICTFSSGGTPSKSNSSYWNGKIPWVSGRDMKSTQLSDSFLHISKSAVEESSTRMAPAGDLLVLVRGMGLAHGAQIAELTVPCAFNQDIRGIHSNSDLIPRYLLFALRDRINSSDTVLSNAAHGTLKIDSDELQKVKIPYPPCEVQQRIVSTIDSLSEETQRLESIYQQKLSALDALKKSLLDQAFTGQL
ncbi:type I restriction enzyme, S subunit [Trichlorobacter thiogenes]|uniref:Type I restriction enzyme, S subunit n=1 Tax=Trichlorobacter thiogenes TaxID=115783 RepID=A0A1T4M637_9BACT|nr:restriction endonuclease subunit S [Trichlorobacter thiogenes]SJZ62316.1 type I restriction enzyme, S subunit [Trichlorobacter thiogenes]